MLLAVDTNVLLDQALGSADVLDAVVVIRERLPEARFIVTTTALEELAFWAVQGASEERSRLAQIALTSLLDWATSR